MDEEQFQLLWESYVSGQMSEKKWQDHIKNDDGFAEWLIKKAPKDF